MSSNMSSKWIASLKSLGKFLGYSVAGLVLAAVTEKGVWGVDWAALGKTALGLVVMGVLKALMTWWKTDENPS